jgi:hypothetical protein
MRAQKKYIETLERRLAYLKDILASAGERQSQFIKAEIAALSWALPILKLNRGENRNGQKGSPYTTE